MMKWNPISIRTGFDIIQSGTNLNSGNGSGTSMDLVETGRSTSS